MFRAVLIMLFFGVAGNTPVAASPVADPEGVWQAITTSFAEKRHHLRSIEVGYVMRQELSGESPTLQRDMVPVMFRRVHADVVSNRFLIREEATSADGGVNLSVYAWDGQLESRLIPLQDVGTLSETSTASGLSSLLPILSSAMLMPGVDGGRGLDDGALHHLLPPEALKEARLTWVGSGETRLLRIAGPRTGPPQAEIDIDPERVMVVAQRFFNPRVQGVSGPAKVARETLVEASQAFEVMGGARVWLPTRIRTTAGFGQATTVQVVEVDVSSVRIGVEPPVFGWVVPFPSGTRVTDRSSGMTSRREAGSDLNSAEAEWVTRVVSPAVMTFVDSRRQGPMAGQPHVELSGSNSRSAPLFWGALLLPLIGAALAMWWMLRHRPSGGIKP